MTLTGDALYIILVVFTGLLTRSVVICFLKAFASDYYPEYSLSLILPVDAHCFNVCVLFLTTTSFLVLITSPLLLVACVRCVVTCDRPSFTEVGKYWIAVLFYLFFNFRISWQNGRINSHISYFKAYWRAIICRQVSPFESKMSVRALASSKRSITGLQPIWQAKWSGVLPLLIWSTGYWCWRMRNST